MIEGDREVDCKWMGQILGNMNLWGAVGEEEEAKHARQKEK